MKIGLVLPYTDLKPAALKELAITADRSGYDTIWAAEGYTLDAVSMLGWLCAHTTHARLATGIINVFSRSAALIGQSAAALDQLSGGRFALGLGTSGPQVVEGWFGMPFERPLQRLRETIEIVRTVVAREPLRHSGPVLRAEGGLRLVNHPLRQAVPIYLAALSPAGVRLAGEIADGWLPAFFAPAAAAAIVPQLERGLSAAGRHRREVRVCAYVTAVVDADIQRARDAARAQLALYLGGMGSRDVNFYADLFARYGYVEETRAVQERYLAGDRRGAFVAVTDAMIDAVSAVGPAGRCREKLAELEAAGVDEVALVVQWSGDPLATIRELAPTD
jgi:F420-dependent oxidoreductase-like protein